MIYSRWRPDTGGYDYFETAERYGLADDLPAPSIGGMSPIGISSLKCGRPIPTGARSVGSGRFAKGVIAPVSRAGLSGTLAGFGSPTPSGLIIGSFFTVLGVLGLTWWRKRRA